MKIQCLSVRRSMRCVLYVDILLWMINHEYALYIFVKNLSTLNGLQILTRLPISSLRVSCFKSTQTTSGRHLVPIVMQNIGWNIFYLSKFLCQVLACWYNLSDRWQDCGDGRFRCSDGTSWAVFHHSTGWSVYPWVGCLTTSVFRLYPTESLQVHIRNLPGHGNSFWYLIKVLSNNCDADINVVVLFRYAFDIGSGFINVI